MSTLNSTLDLVRDLLKIKETQSRNKEHYDVFLSYSTANKDQARIVYNFLSEHNINTFLFEKNGRLDFSWEEVIKDALKSSNLLCLVISPESLHSEWIKTESASAWILEIPILSILYHCATKDLPHQLREHQTINFHEYTNIIDMLQKRK